MSICDLEPGNKGTIHSITGDEKLMKRLMALGCTQGTEIEFKTTAPFGDPLIFNLRGFNLAIRKKDANNIRIMEGDNR